MLSYLPFLADFALIVALVLMGREGFQLACEVLSGIQAAIRETPQDRIEALEAEVQDFVRRQVELAAEVDQLPHTWQEMHNKVRRTEERTRGAVRRALQELEENGVESAELNEIGDQLRIGNGAGSGSGPLPHLPASMAPVPPPAPPSPEDERALAAAYKWSRR